MNWFDTSGLTNLAKTALKEAQKTIDKALDIQDDSGEEQEGDSTNETAAKPAATPSNTQEPSDFLASWGLTVSAESTKDESKTQQAVVTESPAKASNQSVWGSFAGSFFEHSKSEEEDAIVSPPKAKSLNVISDGTYDSQDDLFSKSQLVMSDAEADTRKDKSKTEESVCKIEERRSSSRSAGLSLISSRNSSDSVEVLSQSLHSTPESEAVSVHSISHSSSHKLNSESVEILPDSLVSPSSIECLAFDSYASDKNSSTSSLQTPEGDSSDKKATPVCDRIDKASETADSVSLVADDDDDTISYNSVSECTAPTVLDNDEKSVSPFPKTKPEFIKKYDKELIHLDQPLPSKTQISENSSNDGSWSDRTLNADNDSINLDSNTEELKKETGDSEDNLLERLSDSSSFYSVNVSEMLRSDSSNFYNVEKQQCQPSSTESSQKDGSVKERTSPISSDSIKSDLVKIGSDRTSGHTSGDELETATSSDIEIIPSPNGDGHGFCRSSPAKYAFKQSKFDGSTSPNLVDLVLGKSLATKIRGHNRELSEASIQSNASDDSQGSENERLMRRLCEMAEILESRESRLMEVSRSNAELAESNAELKGQMETLLAKHESGDINTITEDYTQRMSALEKKFQQAIREKDQLRKQLDTLKTESSARKLSSELENSLKEKDEIIAQLQEEGEKLSRQQLQHSNIIKKLRAKEKDNEQVIKGLRDKIAEQSNELDRLKRGIAAKEELEVSQIETVYRLTTANKKLETELFETKSSLDDCSQRLESARTSLEATRRELADAHRTTAELTRRAQARAQAERDAATHASENEILRAQLQQLRNEMVQEEKRWMARSESLRRELDEARSLAAALEGGSAGSSGGGSGSSGGAAALLSQLSSLQRSALERETAHAHVSAHQGRQLAEAQTSLAKAREREKLARDENQTLHDQLATSQGLLEDAQSRVSELTTTSQQLLDQLRRAEELLDSKTRELENLRIDLSARGDELQRRVSETELALERERTALDTEKKRNAILQEQLAPRGDVSPPHSVASDSLSASFWAQEEGSEHSLPPAGVGGVGGGMMGGTGTHSGLEAVVALAQRREGELRAAAAAVDTLRRERAALADQLAVLQHRGDEYQSLQEQYDALLQMYGEKEEQLAECRLDLQDVTQLYKAQLDELIALRAARS